MGGAGALIFFAAFVMIGLSIWGLFNRRRSILCALSSIMVILGAWMGATYAWVESKSTSWTVIYLVVALIGVVSILRQIRGRKHGSELENVEQKNSGDK